MIIQPRYRYLVGAIAGLAFGALLIFGGSWNALAQGSGPNASNALLTCEPTQQVVVRHVVVDRQLQLSMQCVTAPGAGAVRYQDDLVAPVYRAQPVNAVRTVRAPARVATTTHGSTTRRAEAFLEDERADHWWSGGRGRRDRRHRGRQEGRADRRGHRRRRSVNLRSDQEELAHRPGRQLFQ